MAVNGQQKIIEKDGERKDIFEITFSNDALKQLDDLRKYFELEDNREVVKLGISFLERIKNREIREKAQQKE